MLATSLRTASVSVRLRRDKEMRSLPSVLSVSSVVLSTYYASDATATTQNRKVT